MKTRIRSIIPRRIHRFLNLCDRTLVAAAQDLAVLRKYGVSAPQIVKLAHTFERVSDLLHTADPTALNQTGFKRLCLELKKGITEICKAVMKIRTHVVRRHVYHGFLVAVNQEEDSFRQNMGLVGETFVP